MNSQKQFAFSASPRWGIAVRKTGSTRLAPAKLAGFAAAALCLGLLAGCSSNTPDSAANPATRYPFVVDRSLVTQPVIFQAGAIALDEAEKGRLNAFLAHFLQSGGSVLEIRLTAAADDAQAEARLQALHKHVLARGAQPHEIRLHRVAINSSGDGPLILSFERFATASINCNQRNFPTAYNPTNMRHPDIGCALRSNVAAMIANPADLEGPRGRRPGDAMRRGRVIKNYRAGEPTEAARGENESSGSIRDLGG